MTLREQRVLFTALLAQLILWISDQGYQVAIDEGTVHTPRKVRKAWTTFLAEDAVHIPTSFHHQGLAADLLIYRPDGSYVSDGGDKVFRMIARKWESMHQLCTSGIRWNDANHVSLGEGSKATPLPVV